MEVDREKTSHLLGLRGRQPVLRPAPQSNQSFLCALHRSRNRGGGEPNGQIVSVKITADRKRQRSRKIVDKKREKYKVKNGSLGNTSTDLIGTTFVISKNHAKAPIRKGRLSPRSKAKRRPAEICL